ncbi:hypothetical protein NW760_008423 [Fusarium oxysporum]|nr:hypothetical protein NW769_003231 [Fusarium oxysporum]KAJ4227716.1 hypothetical protein NW760_008423 [Fusarium oxysporum]
MPPIKGQSLLVIGGSSGIGAAVAKLALAEGLRVSIASSDPDRVSNKVASLKKDFPGGNITGHVADVSQDNVEARLEKLLTDVTTANGTPLDHIVYTAIRINLKPVSEVTRDYLRDSTQFGYVTPLLLAKLAPGFLKRDYTSSLTFTGGQVGEKPIQGYTIGSMYAAGLYGMVRNLALDMAPLRINQVSPGPTDTELWGPEEHRKMLKEAVSRTALLGKPGSAEEVAEAYIYLMKDSNATGALISTSGGVLLQSAMPL